MAQSLLAGQFTGQRRPGLLPIEPNSFIGRAAEAQRLTALLRSARLVTVVGPGGVGKSRLCLHVASAALSAGRFPDGVWLVELSGLSDPALLASAVAAGLGLPERDADRQRAAVLEHVRDRRMLLILDTCEHLVDACAAFAEAVLRAAPEVTVLATSRQPFDAPGEHAFPVAPLPIEADAVELFAQRAAAAAPGFTVTAANRADVVRLCRRLNGMPLAIELAAVRLRALPLAELADLLDSGFGVLTVTRRGGAARHQTLRTAIEWSHALCTPPEQALWRRLSVFAGPFDLAAAEEVCADAALPADEVVHALIGLVDKSVVMRDGDADGSDAGARRANRYRLLDTLREFGGEQLAEAGEQARFLDRLTDRYLAMAADFDEQFLADDQAGRFQRLRAEHANITAALAHALDDRDGDGGRVGGRPGRAVAARVLAGGPAARLLADVAACSARAGTGSTRRCGSSPGGRRNEPGRSGSAAGWPPSRATRTTRSRTSASPSGWRANSATSWPPPAATSTSTWRWPSPGSTSRRSRPARSRPSGWPPATTGPAWSACNRSSRTCISWPGTSTRPWSAASAAWRCWATSADPARSGGSPARSA